MRTGITSRYIIHQILKSLRNTSISFDDIFKKKLENNKIILSDRKMIHSVVLNSMRYHIAINSIIKKYTKNINKFSDSYLLLLSAITQILILNYKDFAVIDSSVENTKKNNINSSSGFINGVLRNICRNKKKLMHIESNFSWLPSWFIKKKIFQNAKEKKNFIKTIIQEPRLHIVFKNKENIKKIKCKYFKTTDESIIFKDLLEIKMIPGYYEGWWWVQDFSSMLPLYLTNNIKNLNVADFCAAPGGKTFQLLNKGAKVTAIEKREKRIIKFKENLSRLKFNCKIENKDILKIKNDNKFQMIVLDAPCSSIGTIRRNPEIFFRKNSPDFDKIVSTQLQLLKKAASLLKKNGLLIYIVCSFLHEEGKDQIKKFLNQNKNFSQVRFRQQQNETVRKFIDKEGYYYIKPSCIENNFLVDGFFAAKLIKNEK